MRLKADKCPNCGYKLDAATSATGAGDPSPGDLTVCVRCAAVLVFTSEMAHRKFSEEETQGLDPETRALVVKAQQAIMWVQYEEQLQTMRQRARDWLAAHPGADVRVQYNYPPHVAMVTTISEAVKKHIVSASPDGLALMEALWPWDDCKEPTVNMVRTVLENIFGDRSRPQF